ncbi:hypothetical protein BC477_00630 [Clavibacter michiganensis subsp. michiganensis]|uniref:Uncharacterized protein n=1 Tax=Clavibacter michiganensis subsp. michiganensis TaxID=33013 RepID=A0A251XES6_CLAMM|nr:hypothetical protein BC477_00630 [Clavibacter michiganensis subsp. michiganensis]OUE00919.1 hypothetical protein CMMCAS07_15885 [Clavibacter michiganensis subsp. michiganensis]
MDGRRQRAGRRVLRGSALRRPDCYDRVRNPGARAWFLADATDLLSFTADYLALLDRHDVPWQELRSRTPGRIVYADPVQVIAVPHTVDDWPFR